jgi:hypothetical protein
MRNTHRRRFERAAATYPTIPTGERTPTFSNGIKAWLFFTFGFGFGASVINICVGTHLATSDNILVPTIQMNPTSTTGVENKIGWRIINIFVGESDVLAAKAKNDQTRFSQCNQDKMVLALLGEKRSGYFIDLGANHAIR